MAIKLNPAEYVVYVFGGVRKMSRMIGRAPASISAWNRPRTKKGCGGRIPMEAQYIILQIADRFKLPITPEDLLRGRYINYAQKKK
jgi:hypothetical protein